MPSKMTSEIFTIANNIEDKNMRAQFLRENGTRAVQELIRLNFDTDINRRRTSSDSGLLIIYIVDVKVKHYITSRLTR